MAATASASGSRERPESGASSAEDTCAHGLTANAKMIRHISGGSGETEMEQGLIGC